MIFIAFPVNCCLASHVNLAISHDLGRYKNIPVEDLILEQLLLTSSKRIYGQVPR